MYALISEHNEVLEIKDVEIKYNNDSMKVVKLDSFQEGDEINFYIIVNEVDEHSNVMSYSAVKQNSYVKELLANNAELRTKQELMEKAIEDLILGGAL